MRWCAAALSAILLGLGSFAVFLSSNELGTAAMFVVAALFTIVAITGQVPRIRWGGAEVDPTAAYLAGSVAGAERAGDEIGEVLADSPERRDLLEGAVRDVVGEFWSASLTSFPSSSTLGSDATRPPNDQPSAGRPHGVRESSPEAPPREFSEAALNILQRFVNFNETVDHHQVARALLGLGFDAITPQGRGQRHSTAAYLRWVYIGSSRKATLYQNSAGLISDNHQQVEFASQLPGAQREGGVHPKVRFYYDMSGESGVIDAARALRGFADATENAD